MNPDKVALNFLKNRERNILKEIDNKSWGCDWHTMQDLEMTREKIKQMEKENVS